jgi:hypothetical protein
MSAFGCLAGISVGFFHAYSSGSLAQAIWTEITNVGKMLKIPTSTANPQPAVTPLTPSISPPTMTAQGWPIVSPLPAPKEVWECSVVVVGGSLGGVAAASHAMKSGVKTCLIELTPWLGGQISSQGVSALDESLTMRSLQNFSESWNEFKQIIKQQPVELSEGSTSFIRRQVVKNTNNCWVGSLCFPPEAGARAAEKRLLLSSPNAPGSRWGTSIAFKGAEFDSTGTQITGIYAVQRRPHDPNYLPQGRLSQELTSWYSWSSDEVFEKVPIRLQAPPNERMIVIDATDTGDLVGWAGIPHRLGSESRETTGEVNASVKDNPECTQAFTFPFALALRDDKGASLVELAQVKSGISKAEHRREYSLDRFTMFGDKNFFNYRRMISLNRNHPLYESPEPGDITLVNWNQGNDWNWMNPPLIMTDELLASSGQRQNWMGGLALSALKDAENHALLFSEWLIETKSQRSQGFPLTHLSGAESPLGTLSGLSMTPYIREGRRILGRAAYNQYEFMMRESDIRVDMSGGRDFSATAIGVTHYDVDIHGCRYRNWEPSNEATSAPTKEFNVRPVVIPLESLIPQRIDNLLIGGKSIAVTHIVNAATRLHYGEWTIGAAAGTTAAWLINQNQPDLTPERIITRNLMPKLQQALKQQGLRLSW